MTVKVIRVCLDNPERLVGFQFPEILMSLAEKEAKLLALEKKVSFKSVSTTLDIILMVSESTVVFPFPVS